MTPRSPYMEALLCAIVVWAFMGPHSVVESEKPTEKQVIYGEERL